IIALTSISQAEDSVPGIIESLDKLIQIHQKQLYEAHSRVKNNPKLMSSLQGPEKTKIDAYFMRSLIFHSDHRYLQLIKNNECTLYALLENDLLKTGLGPVENIMLTLAGGDIRQESILASKEDFISAVNRKKCFANEEMSKIFSQENVTKTMGRLNFKEPTTENECQDQYRTWVSNPYLPYLCRIPQTTRLAQQAEKMLPLVPQNDFTKRRFLHQMINQRQFYEKQIVFTQRSYLTNLCQNLDDPKQFCANYFSKDIWHKVAQGQSPSYLMSYLCTEGINASGNKIFKNSIDLMECRSQLLVNPDLCSHTFNHDYSSAFPGPACPELAEALGASRLHTDYYDCPAKVNDESLINWHRIIAHYRPDLAKGDKDSCANQTIASISTILKESRNTDLWPLKICYHDIFKVKDICDTYIPGNSLQNPLSESTVMGHVMERYKGGASKDICRYVDESNYNPTLLEYTTGCYLLYKPGQCFSFNCPRKVIYEKKEIKEIQYTGTLTLN
ncbi:MAG: hypothetical protein WCG27_13630, partial [Pseudomonadota bacterium]